MCFFNLVKFSRIVQFKLRSYPTGRKGKIIFNHRSSGSRFFFDTRIGYNCFDVMAVVGSVIKRKLKPNLYMAVFEDGFIGFYLRPRLLKDGELVIASYKILPAKIGNTMRLKYMPVGELVFNVCGIAKSSGTGIKILRHKPGYTLCKLPSKEIKWIDTNKLSTLGSLTNQDDKFHKFYKAGQVRWLGRRPVTRGVAMNPIDHPHGGGQGKTSGGRPSVSPYSQLTKGYKTVRSANMYIFRTRAQQKSK